LIESELRSLRAVVFDLDGTLVDSRLDLAEAVNRTRAALALPPLSVEAILGMVGEGARTLVRRALGDPEPELLDRALVRFMLEYEPICTEWTCPYPGLAELLPALRARYRLAVLTNKPERMSRKIIVACGWSEIIDELIGGDSLPTRKPEPGGLLELGRRLGPAPDEPHDLGPMHPTDAGEASDRLPLAPTRGGVGPLGSASVVGQVAARADDVAEDHARRVRPELTAHRSRAHIFERRPTVLDLPAVDQDHPAVHRGEGLQIAVPDPHRDVDRAVHVRQRVVELTSAPRELTVRDRQVAVGDGLRLAFEELFGSL
jgi:phosphoglycolate phosphatase